MPTGSTSPATHRNNAYTKTWHYRNVDEGKTIDTMPENPDGDVLKAVTTLVAELKAGGLSPEEETSNSRC